MSKHALALSRFGKRRPVSRLRLESLEDRTAPAHLALQIATGGHRSHITGDYVQTFMGNVVNEWHLNAEYPATPAGLDVPQSHQYGPAGDFGGLITNASAVEDSQIGVVSFSGATNSYHSAIGSDISRSATASGSFEANGTVRVVADPGDTAGDPVVVSFDVEGTVSGGATLEYTVGALSGTATEGETRTFTATVGDTFSVYIRGASSVFSSAPTVFSSSASAITLDLGMGGPPPAPVTVTAAVDGSGSATDDDFGTFLYKVKMPDQVFTAASPGANVKKFRFQVDAQTAVTINRSTAGDAAFVFDPSDLSVGVHQLKVTALDSGGSQVGDTFTGRIRVKDSVGAVAVMAKTSDSIPTPVGDLRLIHEVSLDLMYTVTLPDLPLKNYYADKLAVAFARNNTEIFATHQPLTLSGESGSFMFNTSLLPDVFAGEVQADYDVFVTGRQQTGGVRLPLSQKENLFVTKLPKWMGKAVKKEFLPAADVPANTFDTADAAYAIRIDAGDFTLKLPTTSGTPFGMFDGLASGMNFGVGLVVYARLSGAAGSVVVQADDVYVNAKLLGETVLKKSPHVGGNLFDLKSVLGDTLTLSPPASFVLTARDTDLLGLAGIDQPSFNFAFGKGDTTTGKGKWEVSIPLYKSVLLDVDGKLSLNGTFKAKLSKLALGGAIGVTFANGYPAIDKATTKPTLDVQAEAELAVNAGLSVDVTLLKIIKTEAVGVDLRGNAYFRFDSHLAGVFKGDSFLLDKERSHAALGVAFDLSYNLRTAADQIGDPKPNAAPRELAKDSARFRVFDLNLPPENLSTPGAYTKQGTNIDIGGGENIAAFAPAAFESAVAAPGTVDSNVRLRGRVDDSLKSLRVTYSPRANRETPAAGRHLFTVVLIAPDGTVQTLSDIDLSGETYAAAANDLGFAATPKVLDVAVPAGLMEPGTPYSLEFRLRTDPLSDGEEVRIGLSNLELTKQKPELGVTVAGGDLSDGGLDFGPDTGGSTQGVVTLRNDGGGTVKVSGVSLVGRGFEFPVALPKTFTLYAGQSYDIPVRLLSVAAAASAKLKIVTDAPANPIREIPLRYAKDALSQHVSFAVEKSAGTERAAGRLKVVLARPAQGTITVDYAVTGGTAVAGTDFKAFGGTLTFKAGQTVQYVAVPVLNNTINQPIRSVVVSLSNPTGTVLGPIPSATHAIRDDDALVSFKSPTSETTEPASRTTYLVPVVLSAASPFAVTVSYKVTGGSATGGKDYILAAGKLSFAAGEVRKSIKLTLLPDLLTTEGDETIQITLSSPVGGLLGPDSVLTLTLHNHA